MSSSLTLIPINLHNTPERTELLRQRILCGWDKTPQTLQTWREQVDAKTLHLFWIHSAQKEKVGHIASCTKPDILNLGKTVQHICNLFILPEHRGSGLASHAVRAMEEEAGRGGCAAMTLNALSRRYIEDGGKRVWYRKVCDALEIEMPERGRSNEDWYSRLGYRVEREEELYEVFIGGEMVRLWAVWMRKGV